VILVNFVTFVAAAVGASHLTPQLKFAASSVEAEPL